MLARTFLIMVFGIVIGGFAFLIEYAVAANWNHQIDIVPALPVQLWRIRCDNRLKSAHKPIQNLIAKSLDVDVTEDLQSLNQFLEMWNESEVKMENSMNHDINIFSP